MKILLKRDFLEQFKTWKFLIAAAVFLLFGLSAPVLMKMLPKLIPSGTETGGLQMKLVGEAKLADAARQFASFIGQMGALLAVVFSMGTVAGGRSRRIAVMTLTKPVSRVPYVLSRYTANATVFIASLVLGAFAFYGYSVVVFGQYAVTGVPLAIVECGTFLLYVISVTMLCSVLTRSGAGAGGMALAAVFATSVVPGFFGAVKEYGPGYLVENSAMVLARLEGFGSGLPAVVVTLFLAAACLTAACWIFQGKDL